jgi:hypothetical protein
MPQLLHVRTVDVDGTLHMYQGTTYVRTYSTRVRTMYGTYVPWWYTSYRGTREDTAREQLQLRPYHYLPVRTMVRPQWSIHSCIDSPSQSVAS